MQKFLDQNAPLEALFTLVSRFSWPELHIAEPPPWMPAGWNTHLHEFYEAAQLQRLWAEEQGHWESARIETLAVFNNVDFYTFLKPLLGEVDETFVFMPNISYPSDLAVGLRVNNELVCIGPPRIAWGDNPPWPFDEDKGHIFSISLTEYVRLLLLKYLRQHAAEVAPAAEKPLPVSEDFKARYPNWGDQFTALVVPGIVALYLENHVSEQEAKAYVMMEKKAKGVTILPGVINVLQRYLNEQAEGKYESLKDYLSIFPRHLKVTKGIAAL
ncbi:MAG: hypothetical protein HC915_13235 [Anaerolineae bacterium]|nr:hypothetical protein [Anaerolineae bacterium]